MKNNNNPTTFLKVGNDEIEVQKKDLLENELVKDIAKEFAANILPNEVTDKWLNQKYKHFF